jgi:hypothetical protein
MSTFLERLEQEADALALKTISLSEFIKTSNFEELSEANQYLLKKQLEVMLEYTNILTIRIELNS